MRYAYIIALFTASAAASAAQAGIVTRSGGGALDLDILLLPDSASGKTFTGSFEDATESTISTRERVFMAEFGEADPSQPNFASEPGLRGLPSDFHDGSSFSFNITEATLRWDGAAFGLSPHSVTMDFGPASRTTPISLGGFVAGFEIPVSGSGGFDDHFDFFFNGPTDGAADGVYLLTMSFAKTGFTFSDDVFILMAVGEIDGAVMDAAKDHVRSVLVPAPGAAGVLALTCIGLASRRRRA